ncbi:hypothetical protein FRC06_005628, partial [Ceratobasidium sp. 370]
NYPNSQGRPINLVHIWSGLLAYKTPNSGRHQLVHLAIHILSIVANSAGCERLFSEMGHIHTKRRARLTYGKVFDTAVVRMDLKRKHAAAGLTRARLQRQFGLPTPNGNAIISPNYDAVADQHDEHAEEVAEAGLLDEDPASYDITALAAKLHQDVVDDDDPSDSEPENPMSVAVPKRLRLFFGTQKVILLQDLFDYSTSQSEGQGLDTFKRTGLANLQKELEIYDLMTRDLHKSTLSDNV